jgi:hypothetical protein
MPSEKITPVLPPSSSVGILQDLSTSGSFNYLNNFGAFKNYLNNFCFNSQLWHIARFGYYLNNCVYRVINGTVNRL